MNARTLLAAATLLLAGTSALAQDYRFPVRRPASGTQPYITAHRDHDDTAGLDDYACGNKTYNGHKGTDIGIGGFAVFDAGSRAVVAAAPGRVAALRDGCFDRCTSADCTCGDGFGNYVRIDHPDGKRTYYGHLRKNSVEVTMGQEVTCGTVLGYVGSSGHSTGPHLHFEVRHSNNVSDDPYRGECGGPVTYWVEQGAYNGLPGDTCDGATEPPPPPPPSTGTLRGVVFEDRGSGTADTTIRLTGATVRLEGTSTTATAAGAGASWSFTANEGSRTVRASLQGFMENTRTCTVTAGQETWCSVGLVRIAAPPPDAGTPPPPPPDAGTPPPPDAGVTTVPDAAGAPDAAEASDAAVEGTMDASTTLDAGNSSPAEDAGDVTARDAGSTGSVSRDASVRNPAEGTGEEDPGDASVTGPGCTQADAPTMAAWVFAVVNLVARRRRSVA